MPVFIMYPVSSTNESISYKYSFKDYDNALEYEGEELILKLYEIAGTRTHKYDKKVQKQEGEVTFNSLVDNTTYELGYKYRLLKSEVDSEETLFKQLFEKIIATNEMNKITYELSFDNSNNPNNIIITLPQNCTNVQNIVGGKVTLKWSDNNTEISETTDLLELNYDRENDRYFIEVDILSLQNASKIIDKEVLIAVKLYYDDNYIGFYDTELDTYSVLVNASDDYKYLDINNGTLDDAINGVRGNASIIDFEDNENEEYVYLNVTDLNGNNKKVDLKRTSKGLTYGEEDSIIVQKRIVSTDLTNTATINIENLIAGINVDEDNIITDLQTAEIPAELINPDNKIYIDTISIEISKRKNNDDSWKKLDGSQSNTNEHTDIKLTADNWKDNTIGLTALEPTYSYRIRFKYTGTNGNVYYMYDKESKEIGKYYYFNTISTIGINNISVTYNPISYVEKYLDINYNIERARSNIYPKTKYEIFDKDNKKVILTQKNIVTNEYGSDYKIIDGALYVNNARYNENGNIYDSFDSVYEKIKINPDINVFEFGEQYTLKITPIVYIGNSTEQEIETESFDFTLQTLTEPRVGIKIIRQEKNDKERIKATIQINDEQCNIYGQTVGEYKLQVFKYQDKDNKQEVTQVLDINNNNVYGNNLNINNHGKNYSIYIDEVDYSWNYEIKLTMKVDIKNDTTTQEKSYSKVLEAIDNPQGIEVGDNPQVVNVTEDSIDLMFFDSYKLQKIDSITYTAYDNLGIPTVSQEKVFKEENWNYIAATENDPDYYQITLDGLKNRKGINILEIMLKYGDTEIKRFTMKYEYK